MAEKFYVHYTVVDPNGPDTLRGVKVRRLIAGPYTMDEALAERRALDNGRAVNVFIDEEGA